MIIRLTRFIYILPLMFCVVQLPAQTGSGRQVFIDRAIEQSVVLQSASARIRSAEAVKRRSTAWEAPTFAFEFYSTPITSLNPLKDGLENDYSIQQMIPFPGKIARKEEIADAGIRIYKENAAVARRTLIADVNLAYAQLVTAREKKAVNSENIDLLSQIMHSLEAAYTVERASYTDMQRARAELALRHSEASEIAADEIRATAMLNTLTNTDARQVIGEVQIWEAPEFHWDVDSLVNVAFFSREELRAALGEIDMRTAQTNFMRKQWLPDLMLRAMYKEMTMGMPDYWSLMLGISVPIAPWSGNEYAGAVEEAEAQAIVARAQLENVRRMISYEVQDAWATANASWDKCSRYRKEVIPYADQALQTALTAYTTGSGDFTTLLDAARMLVMFRMDAVSANGAYLKAIIRLERAVGSSLNL